MLTAPYSITRISSKRRKRPGRPRRPLTRAEKKKRARGTLSKSKLSPKDRLKDVFAEEFRLDNGVLRRLLAAVKRGGARRPYHTSTDGVQDTDPLVKKANAFALTTRTSDIIEEIAQSLGWIGMELHPHLPPWMLNAAGDCNAHADCTERKSRTLVIPLDLDGAYTISVSASVSKSRQARRTNVAKHFTMTEPGQSLAFDATRVHWCTSDPTANRIIINAVFIDAKTYTVEKILERKGDKVLVKWEGYIIPTWEPAETFD